MLSGLICGPVAAVEATGTQILLRTSIQQLYGIRDLWLVLTTCPF